MKILRIGIFAIIFFCIGTLNVVGQSSLEMPNEHGGPQSPTAELRQTKSDVLNKITFFLAGSALIGLTWFLTKKKKRRSGNKVRDNYNKAQQMVIVGAIGNAKPNNEINRLRIEIDELKSIIAQKEKEMKYANETIFDLKQQQSGELNSVQELHGKNIENTEIVVPTETVRRHLYFPSPLANGSFRKIDGSEVFIEGASIYRFTLISDSKAHYEICDDNSSNGMALNNRNDLILSVAEEQEGNHSSAKRILTFNGQSGEAVLEDDKWTVVKKLLIKYI